jgi:Zn-dependent protease
MDEHPQGPFWDALNSVGNPVDAEIIEDDLPTDPFEQSVLAELEKLRNPRSNWVQAVIVLGVSLALFIGLGMRDSPIAFTALLIAVLFIHEMGHYIGMRAFGYRNVRMFFIPLFGAAVSGQKISAKGYQEAIVTLLGPLPGLLVAVALLVAACLPGMNEQLRNYLGWASAMFALINGFNLLPILPLDGGRLLNQVLFSRNRYLEGVFLVVASLALIALGVAMATKVLWILGIWMLLTVGATFKTNSIAQRVGEQFVGRLPAVSDPIPTHILRPIVADVRTEFPAIKTAKGAAAMAFRVWEKMHAQMPGALATVSLLAAYLTGWLLVVPWAVLFLINRAKH